MYRAVIAHLILAQPPLESIALPTFRPGPGYCTVDETPTPYYKVAARPSFEWGPLIVGRSPLSLAPAPNPQPLGSDQGRRTDR